MRKFELKKVVELLLKTDEERTPINPKRKKASEIPMDRNLSTSDIFRNTGKEFKDESLESRKEEIPEKMSLLRKLCFVLSLNGGVMYFLVLAWLLPCRDSPCLFPEESWRLNLTNIRLTTNLEVAALNNLSIVMFGYSDDAGGHQKMEALRISDGEHIWNRTLSSKANHVFCRVNGIDVKLNGKPMCIVTADDFVAAFDAETGDALWQRNVTSTQKISKIALTRGSGNRTYIMGVSMDYLYLIDALNGTETSVASLPCSWTVDVKIAGPWLTRKGYMWSIVCEYGDGAEVYTFKERELLSLRKNSYDNTSPRKDVTFKPLFSQQSYSGSIDLAGDVTSTPHSLVLSWADMVTMVTDQAPSHHLHKTWERHFSDPHEYDVEVTGIIAGHFKNSKSMEIAVAVNSNFNSTIYILETRNGTSIKKEVISNKAILSIKKIPGKSGEMDTIFVESVNSSRDGARNNPGTKSYFTIHFENSEAVFQNIATLENVYDSKLSVTPEASSDLLIASSDDSGNSLINRLIIKNKNWKHNFCKFEHHKNTSVIMFLE